MTSLAPNLADYSGIGLALALGLLVGVQRGWAQRDAADGSRFAGLRTYGLLGLAGGLAGHLFARAETLATVLVAAVAGLVVAGYWRSSGHGARISGTASLVGLLALGCGFLAATGEGMLATSITVIMVLLLALRNQLHGLIERLDEAEVLAIARLALIAAVILPLLPDTAYGPLDAWNPRKLWLVVVLVSAFSFAGYVAARLLGPSRGTIATSAAGAMVSSTAVTASLAQRMREGDTSPVLSAGVMAASAVMFARVVVLTGLIAPFALGTLAALIAPGLIVSLAATGWFLWQARLTPALGDGAMPVRNPFSLGPALLLMALVMVVTLAARWVQGHYGDAGIATVLALSGMFDADSAIIAMGALPPGTLEARTAGLVLLPPILLNTLIKAGAAISIAGWKAARGSALGLAGTALASGVATLIALLTPA